MESGEGTSDTSYWVKLANVATAPTEEAPLSVTITPAAPVSVSPRTLSFDGTTNTDSLEVTVTVTHDLNLASESAAITHSATGYGDADFTVKTVDDDFAISVDTESVREDDAAKEVEITVTAGAAPDADLTVSVEFGEGGGAEADDFTGITAADVTISMGETSGTAKVMVDAIDDGEKDEMNESIELTVSASNVNGVYYKPAEIMILDDDPDIQLSLSQDEVDEDAGTVTVTVTATASTPVAGIVEATIALTGTATAGDSDSDDYTATAATLTIDAAGTTATATVTLTIRDDGEDESNETIIFSAGNVTVGDKAYTFGSATVTIVDNDDT